MLFTLGMTADAAAAHRHEFSHSPSGTPQIKPSISQPDPVASPSSSMMSACVSLPGFTSWRPVSAGSTLVPQSPASIVGTEADMETLSDGGFSGTSSNDIGVRTKRRKVASKLRTTYQIAHPAPVIKHKQRLKIRPRVLLQLQQLSNSSRPIPALDVLPSVLFAPRLAQKFPRMCKGKEGLGANDLVVVSSEAYDTLPNSTNEKHDDSEEESWDHRELIATIRQAKKDEGGTRGKVEISLNHGSSWEATPLLNGGYEFVAKEGSRTVARWVPRISVNRRRSNTLHNRTSSSTDEEKKFNFSIVNPNTRRHPVIASITRTTIDILDRYPAASSTEALHPHTSPLHTPSSIKSSQGAYFEPIEVQPRTMIETDEQLRTLIVVTGIWLVFRENWSQNFRYSDAMSVPLVPISANSTPTDRAVSMYSDHGIKNRTSAPIGLSNHHGALHSLGGRVRRTSAQILHRSHTPTTSTASVPAHDHKPRRAHSTGTAFVKHGDARSKRGPNVTGQSNPNPGLGSNDNQIWHAPNPRRAHTTTANGSAARTLGLSSLNTTSSERQAKTSGSHSSRGAPKSAVSSPKSSTSKRDPTGNNYINGEGQELSNGRGKGPGRLDRLFSIVRRTSNTSQR
ncbi:hypothetical protein MMC16_007027 [Acarospora aff. strigata]|nr:hypothetical protein [Acarospora aff. strigata]